MCTKYAPIKNLGSLWPNESSIQEILDSPDFRDPELELEESDSEEELEEEN